VPLLYDQTFDDPGGPGTLTLKLSLIVMSTIEVDAGR
jgi:hypothetical protein